MSGGLKFLFVVGIHKSGRALQAACLLARPPHVLSSLNVGQDLVVKLLKLISFPIRRLKVDDSVLPDFRKELRSSLEIRGPGGIASDSLLVLLC
jgi:hypothetical protein